MEERVTMSCGSQTEEDKAIQTVERSSLTWKRKKMGSERMQGRRKVNGRIMTGCEMAKRALGG